MRTPASAALAVELNPHSPTHWVATYYPMVHTPAGRWADVTWELHRRLMPHTAHPVEPARWMEARSADPDDPCYAHHRMWSAPLAAGYAAALAVQEAEAVQVPLALPDPQHLLNGTVVIPVGQLSEWVLEDLQDETTRAHG